MESESLATEEGGVSARFRVVRVGRFRVVGAAEAGGGAETGAVMGADCGTNG